MIEISFPDKSPADAGTLAKNLRLALVRAGMPDQAIRIVKERPDTMDVGSIVHLVEISLSTIACAKAIWDICVPARSSLRIKMPDGKAFELKTREIELDRLQSILNAVPPSGAALPRSNDKP